MSTLSAWMLLPSQPDNKTSDKVLLIGWIAGIALIVLSRLPQLMGANLLADGDEAILGLMAKHISEGRTFELFFYGQSFGVSLVESLGTALVFLLLGVSTLSLKLAALLLWLLGWSFFLLGTRRLTNTYSALLAGLLLLSCPAWATWSLLARGYHIGGFALAMCCFWQFTRLYPSDQRQLASSALLGACLGLLLMTQAIWFLSLCPFTLLLLWKKPAISSRIAVIAGGLGTCLLIIYGASDTASDYWSPRYLENPDAWLALKALPQRLLIHLSGAYFYRNPLPASWFNYVATAAWCALTLVALAAFPLMLLRQPKRYLPAAAAIGIILVLTLSLVVDNNFFGYRHLLPVSVCLCLWLGLYVNNTMPQGAPYFLNAVLIGIAVAAGLVAVLQADSLRKPESLVPTELSAQESMQLLINDVRAEGIAHIYSLDPMLQWQIMFSSNEAIIARWTDPKDRRPEYPLNVDEALFANQPVAIVGTAGQLNSFAAVLVSNNYREVEIRTSGDRYFWVKAPTPELLQAAGFALNKTE
ncbi:MAG: hypothetical protein ACR2P6_10215 [Gammaproteobacteria bacterium]